MWWEQEVQDAVAESLAGTVETNIYEAQTELVVPLQIKVTTVLIPTEGLRIEPQPPPPVTPQMHTETRNSERTRP